MPKARRVPCLPCKEKHLRCDGDRPSCQRCKSKSLQCRRPSETTTFIRSMEDDFSKDQKWVKSRVKKFCFDLCEPSDADPGPDSFLSSEAAEIGSSSDDSPRKPPESKRYEVDNSLNSGRLGGFDHGAFNGDASAWDPRPMCLDDEALNLSAALNHYCDNISPGGKSDSYSTYILEQPHPSITAVRKIRSDKCREFPLRDFKEACLLKYYIDEVAPWFDIADPDRHFELVVPIIARSKPHLLNAIFALAARHLACDAEPRSRGRAWYEDQLLPRLGPLSAVEYMLECIPAVRLFYEGLDDEDLESIILTAVILRQLEQIDRDIDSAGHSLQTSSQRLGLDAPPKQDTFLSMINGILQSPHFKTLFYRSGIVRAAYLMVLRQEVYYSLACRRDPFIIGADCSPDTPFIQEATMHMIQVLQLCWGDATKQEWDRLIRQQDHLEKESLLGIQPLFQQPADGYSGEVLPMIWYGSKTEAYCIQLAKMAKSLLIMEGVRKSTELSSGIHTPEATKTVKGLILEIHSIAAGRAESPHATFHAVLMAGIFGHLFTDQEEKCALQMSADRFKGMKIWPFKKLNESEIIEL